MLNAVINSTPLISLHCIDKLDVLGNLYSNVYIPYAVFEEVNADDINPMTKDLLLSFPFISIVKVSNLSASKYFKTALHSGEVETMILADELKADICIIDDRTARNYAISLGLKITGTIGVLIKAKEKGIIDKMIPLLDLLIENEIYVSDKLYESIKKIVGE